ncbi:MAG: metal ABC transporter permease [Caldilineaceae bacterium]
MTQCWQPCYGCGAVFALSLLVLIAVTIVVALQTVGIALVLTMLVTPAATAQLLTRRLPAMMVTAAIFGAGANVTGLYLSYYANIASGPAMVLVATAVFLMVFFLAPHRGLLAQRLLQTKSANIPLSSEG